MNFFTHLGEKKSIKNSRKLKIRENLEDLVVDIT